jgi:hypothetical protein
MPTPKTHMCAKTSMSTRLREREERKSSHYASPLLQGRPITPTALHASFFALPTGV